MKYKTALYFDIQRLKDKPCAHLKVKHWINYDRGEEGDVCVFCGSEVVLDE